MRILSLFGGVECSYPSFQELGITVSKYYTAEIDEYAISITKHNIPDAIHLGDVTSFDFTTLKGEVDMVIGGSPCTYWSISKKDREVTSDGIGYELFMHYVRAIKETGAKYFVYENNFSIHQDIKDAITKELGVQFIMINSSLVSAQNRRRCYWSNLPIEGMPEDKKLTLQDILEEEVETKYHVNPVAIEKYIRNGKPKGFKELDEKAGTITATVHKGYGNDGCTTIRVGHFNKGAQADRVYSPEGKTVNLIANGGGRGAKTGLYEIGESIRRLTPLECERAQTLPDNWTKFGVNKKGETVTISDTQRYKCVGNGWTREVFTFIYSFIPKM